MDSAEFAANGAISLTLSICFSISNLCRSANNAFITLAFLLTKLKGVNPM